MYWSRVTTSLKCSFVTSSLTCDPECREYPICQMSGRYPIHIRFISRYTHEALNLTDQGTVSFPVDKLHVTDPICATLVEKQIGIGSLEPCGVNPAGSYGHEQERKAQNTYMCKELMKFLWRSWVQRKPLPTEQWPSFWSLTPSFFYPSSVSLFVSFLLSSFLLPFWFICFLCLSFFASLFSSFPQRVNKPSRFLYHFHLVGVHISVTWKWIDLVKPWQNANAVSSHRGPALLACQQKKQTINWASLLQQPRRAFVFSLIKINIRTPFS